MRVDECHKMDSRDPYKIISFIDINYPQVKGLCFYDKENKCLASKSPNKADFHYDPIHGCINVRIK